MRVVLWLVKPKAGSRGKEVQRKVLQKEVRYTGAGGERYIWDRDANQISGKSWRVTDRFTGEMGTAKVYQWPIGREDRDREIAMFAREKVHGSIVKYKEAVMLDGVPAAITDTHEGMVPFAVMELDLPNMHPGLRCRLAADMFRPLFGAVEYLHHNRVLHGSVNSASVLVRMVDDKMLKLLLVDYSQSFLVGFGEDMPKELLHFEGAEAMELIASCSNLWALRKTPLPEMRDQEMVRNLTELAEEQFNLIMHGAADISNRQPALFKNVAEPKLQEILARAERKWAEAREAQILNPELMHVGPLSRRQLQNIKREWAQFSAANQIKGEHPMVLTLGHSWLDDLVNPLQSASRYFQFPTPSAICNKLRYLEGEDPKPWQTFRVQQAHMFQAYAIGIRQPMVQIASRDLADYLAACCETYPELREAILEDYNRIIVPNGDMIFPEYIEALHESLQKRLRGYINANEPSSNPLPSAMSYTLEALSRIDVAGPHTVSETCDIIYHRPSQMLHTFSDAFNLTVLEQPEIRHGSALHDPSDFSQFSSRIVLAHEGLVGYALMDRRFSQISHCSSEEKDFARYPSSETFLSTLFGDMKILPEDPKAIFGHPRPTHWAKFKTANEMEAAAETGENNMLPQYPTPVGVRDPEAQCHLKQALRNRTEVITQTTAVYKPPPQDRDPDGPVAQLFRRAKSRESPSMTFAQLYAEPNLQRIPPNNLDRPIGPFPPVAYNPTIPHHLKQIMEGHFWGSPNDRSIEPLAPEVQNELDMVGNYRRASPTEVDDSSVLRKAAQSTARGIPEVPSEASSDNLDRFPPLPASLRRHLPHDASSVHWRNSALPLDVRAFDARSFNDFGAQVAPAPTSRTKVGHTKDWQSFYAGQNNIRQRGMTVREHQRAGMSLVEPEKLKERDRMLAERVDMDGDEDMADSNDESGHDDSDGDGSDLEGDAVMMNG